MKKRVFYLSVLAMILTSCSQEAFLDVPEEVSYEDFLIEKSKEFAQKYNINLELDRNALQNSDHYYSAEEIEEVYKSLSGFSLHDKSAIKWTSENKGKMKIKRRVSLGEGAVTPPGHTSTSFNFQIREIIGGVANFKPFLNIGSTVSWSQPISGHGTDFYEEGTSSYGKTTTSRSKHPIMGYFRGNKTGVANFRINTPMPAPFKEHSFFVDFSFEDNDAYWSITPTSLNDSIRVIGGGYINSSVTYDEY